MSVTNVEFRNLGCVDYKSAWDYQENLFKQIISIKENNKKQETKLATPDYLLFCEHPHVYTIGKSGKDSNLLINEEALKSKGASLYKINRGGDITYHGPGQLIIYLLLDIKRLAIGPKRLVSSIESAIITLLANLGINAATRKGAPGVYVSDEKIAEQSRLNIELWRCR